MSEATSEISQESLATSTAERHYGLEAGGMSKYKGAFEHVIASVEANMQMIGNTLNVTGEVEGIRYQARLPHLRAGKHAYVAVIDLNTVDGGTTSAVIRNKTYDAISYVANAAEHPIINKFVPELYGISGDWVVMERLQGLELEELETRLRDDEEFRRIYAQGVFEVIFETANAGLTLRDIAFINGHNVMVDPETAKIRLVEQRTLEPAALGLQPNELVTEQLFIELEKVSDQTEDWRVAYALELMKIAIERVTVEDLHVRSRAIKPTHPNYRNAYYAEQWERLSDEEYQRILTNPVAREGLTVTMSGNGRTKVVSDATIEAIKTGDVQQFKNAIEGRKFRAELTDKDDPRYSQIVLPDPMTNQ